MTPMKTALTALLLSLSLTVANGSAGTDLSPEKVPLAAFTVLKAEVLKVIVLLRQPDRAVPQGTGTGSGGPDEERAIQRIRAMASQLAGTSVSMDQRIQTIRTIAEQGRGGPMAREQAVDAIGQCLTNTAHGEAVQGAAIEAIGRIGFGSRRAPRVIGVVLRGTANPIPVRIAAIRALREITYPETLHDALEALSGVVNNTGHGEPVQLEAIEAIAFVGRDDTAAVRLLSRVLADTSRPISVRKRTISSMLQLRDPAARDEGVAGLTQAILNSAHDASVQLAAVEAMAFIGRYSRSALQAYGRVLQHTQNPIDVRVSILRVLTATPPENAGDALQALSSVFKNSGHGDRVQIEAARAAIVLGGADPAGAVEVLGMPLRGQAFVIAARIEAIRGLAQVGRGQRRAEEILESVLRDSGHADQVRQAAQQALDQLYRG